MDARSIEQGERLLARKSLGWKLAMSLWVLVVGVGFVFFSVLGWALGALLSRSRKMWVVTAVWGVIYAAALVFFFTFDDGPYEDLAVLPFLIAWIGSTAHAAYLARGVMRSHLLAAERDAGLRGAPAHAPAPPQPPMTTIPLPDGTPRLLGDVRDSGPPIPGPGQGTDPGTGHRSQRWP